MSAISAPVRPPTRQKQLLTACVDDVALLRRRLSRAPNVAYLDIVVMGAIAPPAILHSTDINRSSQDTQQRRASQTEPVRRGAGGWAPSAHCSTSTATESCRGPNLSASAPFFFTIMREERSCICTVKPQLGVRKRLRGKLSQPAPIPYFSQHFNCPVSAGSFIISPNPKRRGHQRALVPPTLHTPSSPSLLLLLPPPPLDPETTPDERICTHHHRPLCWERGRSAFVQT